MGVLVFSHAPTRLVANKRAKLIRENSTLPFTWLPSLLQAGSDNQILTTMARMGLIFIIGITAVVADLCPEPVIPNGGISGRKSDNFFSGQVRCDRGFQLIGNSRLKCKCQVQGGFPKPEVTWIVADSE